MILQKSALSADNLKTNIFFGVQNEEFSPRAKEIVSVFAQDEARKLGSKQLLPEHVILAMIKNKEGLAYQVFEKLLLEADALLDFIENSLQMNQKLQL